MVASESLTPIAVGASDRAGALALSDASGWNQTADDWALFIGHGQVLGHRSEDGELVATGAALPYDCGQGWISMVLVTAAWRHRGLATGLLDACVSILRAADITPVLDATPAGAPVYRRMGFTPGFEFERWEGELPAAPAAHEDVAAAGGEAPRPAEPGDLDAVASLDAAASLVGRRFLLQAFLARPDSRAWLTRDGSGFVLTRAGRRATQIGPLVAADARGAVALLDAAFAGLQGRVFLDVPAHWPAVIAWLHKRGFYSQRPFVRMALGKAAALHGSRQLFVVAGPEFG
jgi:GNAT superfamily N-acetyltransferase